MLLCLDLATMIGWCKGDGTRFPMYGSHKLPSTGDDIGAFLSAYHSWLIEQLNGVDRIVFEAPIIKNFDNGHTVTKLHSLAGHTEFVANRKGIVCRKAQPLSIKKSFLGHVKRFPKGTKAAERKAPMIQRAIDLGFKPENSDEADAIAIFLHVLTRKEGQLAANGLVSSWVK